MPKAPLSATVRPVAVIAPPVPSGPVVVAVPEISTSPPVPARTMSPLRPPTVFASTVPDRLIAWRAAFLAAAESCTDPPSAAILPELRTGAPPPSASVGTATCRKPSPDRPSVARSPEPDPTLPSGTVIVPALSTAPPSSAA